MKQELTGESRAIFGRRLGRAALVGASFFALCIGAAAAQETATTTSAGQSSSGDEEVLVTAQKREQAIDDVPMSIDALSAHQLQNQGVLRVENLDRAVAGFTYAESRVGTPIYTLRGVGFNDIALGGRPTVSVYNDEAPVPFAIETRSGFFDVSRVEVLKGPQGTLFGQNSTGGAINIIANHPGQDFEAGFDVGAGNFGAINAGGYVSMPLSQNLGVRIAAEHQQDNGWQRNFVTGQSMAATDLTSGRMLVDWDPTSALHVALNLNGYHDRSESQAPQATLIFPGIPPAAGLVPGLLTDPLPPQDDRSANFTPDDYARDNTFLQANLRLDYDLSAQLKLTSLTSVSSYDEDQTVDVDGLVTIGLQQRTLGKINSFFQELRLGWNVSENAFLTAGVNYAVDRTREFNTDDISQSTLGLATGLLDFNLQNDQNIDTSAVFANLELDVSERLTVYGGARYTRSNNEFTGCTRDSGDGAAAGFVENVEGLPNPGAGNCISFDPVGGFPLLNEHLNEDNVSWRVGADYHLNEDVLLYGNISRGYKAGGFPTLGATLAAQYAPAVQEQLTAYEVGFKGQITPRLHVNGAVYLYDYQDKQVLGFTNDPTFGPLLRLNNVPEAQVIGLELETRWQPIDGLTLSAVGSFIQSEVTGDYISQDAFGATRNFKGESFPNAPDTSIALDANYQWPISGSLDANVGANASYRSDTNSEFGGASDLAIDGYTLLDLRAGIASHDGRWRLSAWMRNATDQYYWTFASKTNDNFIRFTGRPRTFGLTLGVNF